MTVIPNLIRDLIKIFLNLIFYVINKFCSVINLRGFFFIRATFCLVQLRSPTKNQAFQGSAVYRSSIATQLLCSLSNPCCLQREKYFCKKKRLLKIRSLFVSYTGFEPVTHALKVWDNSKKDLISILITALFYTSICN